jgi:hypothetical protein
VFSDLRGQQRAYPSLLSQASDFEDDPSLAEQQQQQLAAEAVAPLGSIDRCGFGGLRMAGFAAMCAVWLVRNWPTLRGLQHRDPPAAARTHHT